MEKQEKKTSKFKAWWEKNKSDIEFCLWGMFMGAAGLQIGKRITGINRDIGTLRMHDKGILKYFDPDTGKEVDMDEACEVVKRVFRK